MKQYTPHEISMNTQYLFSFDESMGGYPQGVFLATPVKREIKDWEYEVEGVRKIHTDVLHLTINIDKVLNDGEEHWLPLQSGETMLRLFENEYKNVLFIEDSSDENIKDLFFNSNYFLPCETTPKEVKEYFYSQWVNGEDGLVDSFNSLHPSEHFATYNVDEILNSPSEYTHTYQLPVVHEVCKSLEFYDREGNLNTPTFIVRREDGWRGNPIKQYLFFKNSDGVIRDTPYVM